MITFKLRSNKKCNNNNNNNNNCNNDDDDYDYDNRKENYLIDF